MYSPVQTARFVLIELLGLSISMPSFTDKFHKLEPLDALIRRKVPDRLLNWHSASR